MREHSTFVPDLPEEKLIPIQLDGIRKTINNVKKHSPQYQKKLHGIESGDIHTLEDIQKLPFTTADDLRLGYPFPLLSVEHEKVVRVHASSGTTGKRKILAYTQKDVDTFALQMARCYELAGLTKLDRVQIAVGYGLWTAGVGFQFGAELFGAMSIPIGPGNLDIHLQLLQDMESSCIVCTSSMALLMAEEVERHGLKDKVKLRRAIFGSEASSAKMRKTIMEKLDLEDCFDIGGMTETYGPGSSIDCEAHEGLHYWGDLFYYEIIDPETQEVLPHGEQGELVITSLCKEASPLIRYRTRDLTRIIPGTCSCGRNLPRHDRFMGRSDDMIIVRGVNIYPGQISDIIQLYPELGGEYHVELTRKDAKDFMHIKLERHSQAQASVDEALIKKFAANLQKKLMLSGTVEVMNPGTLPRAFGKAKRVTDLRFD